MVALEAIVRRLGKVDLTAKALVFLRFRLADDHNHSVSLTEEGIVCFGESDTRNIGHVADASVMAA